MNGGAPLAPRRIMKRLLQFVIFLAVAAATSASAQERDLREWTGKGGETIRAALLESDADTETARIRRSDGLVFTVPWDRFDKSGRERLRAAAEAGAGTGAAGADEDGTRNPEPAPPPERLELDNVPMVRQKGNFCVPAAATMIAGFHDVKTNQDEVAYLSSRDSISNQGTRPGDMFQAMRKLGFGGRIVTWSGETEFFDRILPAIRESLHRSGPIYISFKPGVFGDAGHGSVIVGYNNHSEEMAFHNPWGNTFEKSYETVAKEGRGVVLIEAPEALPVASDAFIEEVREQIPRFDGNLEKLPRKFRNTGFEYELIGANRRDSRDDERFARDTAREEGRKILRLAFRRNPAVILPHSPGGKTTKLFFVTRPRDGGARFLVREIDGDGWSDPELKTLGRLTRNWPTKIGDPRHPTNHVWELPMLELRGKKEEPERSRTADR